MPAGHTTRLKKINNGKNKCSGANRRHSEVKQWNIPAVIFKILSSHYFEFRGDNKNTNCYLQLVFLYLK